MANPYKIELGVKLNTSDLSADINKLDNKYKLKLGVNVAVDDIRKRISEYNKNTNNAKLKLGIKLDTSDLKEQINKLNLTGNSTKGASIPVNTDSLEASLKEVKGIIADIKTSLGSMDGGDMKSLLTSVNQIADALGKATDESQNLVNSLNALSKKDFSFNLGFNTGSNSFNNNAAYGRVAKSETLPQLKEQYRAIAQYVKETTKSKEHIDSFALNLAQSANTEFDKHGLVKTNVMDLYGTALTGNLQDSMNAYKQLISMMKKGASMRGVNDLSPALSGFSQSAEEIVEDTLKIRDGTKQAEDSMQKLKQIFGSGIDSDSLTKILSDLNEIRESLAKLSSNESLGGLNSAFGELSQSINNLIANADKIRSALGNGFDDATNDAKEVAQAVKQTGDAMDGVANNVSKAKNAINNSFDSVESSALDVEEKLKRISNIKIDIKDGIGIDSLKRELNNIGFDTASIDRVTKEFEEMGISIRKVTSSLNKDGTVRLKIDGVDGAKKAVSVIKDIGVNADNMAYEVQDANIKTSQSFTQIANAVSKVKKKLSGSGLKISGFDDEINTATSRFNALSNQTDNLRLDIQELVTAFNSIKAANVAGDIHAIASANEHYEDVLKRVNLQLKQQEKAQRDSNTDLKLQDDIRVFQSKIDAWMSKNSAATKQFGAALLDLKARAEGCDRVTLNHLESELTQIDNKAEQAGLKFKSFGDRLKDQFRQYSTYLSGYSLFMYAGRGLRSMFEQVKLIDSAMTELKKVTNETDAAYDRFLGNAANRAKEIGTTIDGLVASTADFARLGYGFEDAQGLAEVANIYAVVGDEVEGVEGATESLISTMAAFKDEMNGLSNTDFSMSIIDKMNEVGNNFAISSGGIGEALKRASSSMAAANNSLDETIALITAANTVVKVCHAA